jgi:hypothetical protein
MMKRTVVVGLFLGIIACKHDGAPTNQPTAAQSAREPGDGAPTCANVMPKMTEAAWRLLERGGAGPDIVDPARERAVRIEPQLVQACIDDRWSPDLRRCIAETPVLDLDHCVELVTPEQEATVIRIREDAEREP